MKVLENSRRRMKDSNLFDICSIYVEFDLIVISEANEVAK